MLLNWLRSDLVGAKVSASLCVVVVVGVGSTGSSFTLRGGPALVDFAAVGALPLAVAGGCGRLPAFPDEELPGGGGTCQKHMVVVG